MVNRSLIGRDNTLAYSLALTVFIQHQCIIRNVVVSSHHEMIYLHAIGNLSSWLEHEPFPCQLPGCSHVFLPVMNTVLYGFETRLTWQ